MKQAVYILTGEALTPAVIRIGDRETPVWHQKQWPDGEFACYIHNNGCGHCCAAMAARLHGVDLDPYREYELCRSLWGEPTPEQGHWLTTAGVKKVLRSLNVPAESFGVKQVGAANATAHILAALKEGKQVIFTSNPDDDPDNPFSKGYHWVMAVAQMEDGSILIANSSDQAAPLGVQTVTPEVIQKALFAEALAPEDMTWGEADRIHEGSGYVIVG